MNKHLIVSISALALAAAVALPATADDATTNAAAGATAGANAAGVDASTTASTTAASTFTVDNVLKDKPFGDITFDQTKSVDEISTALTDPQKLELQQRCDVVIANETVYDPSAFTWCQSYIDWWKKSHPAG